MSDDSKTFEMLEHAALRWLIARIRTSNPDTVASLLFDEFADALGAHLALIDDALIPSLRGAHDGAAMQYIDSHWYLKRSLAELRTMNRHTEAFAKRLLAVCNRLERQLMREATEWLPRLHDPSEGARAAA